MPSPQFSPRSPHRKGDKTPSFPHLCMECKHRCMLHPRRARTRQCSKERKEHSQHPQNDANGSKHLCGSQLIRNQNKLPLKHLSQVQPRNHQNQLTPTVPPTREILPAFPCCFKTPRHKGSDVRTIARIPTAKPPMETPHIDRIYASLLIT